MFGLSFGKKRLFRGNDALFKQLAESCTIYGEYGVGQSTLWMYRNTRSKILSVDSSSEWIGAVAKDMAGDSDRLEVEWVDIGPLGEWGSPLTFSRRRNFRDYVASIWRHSEKPDFVLIDGRFRIACLFVSLLNGDVGTRILFDDYLDRPKYHVVEEVLKPVQFCGRQALFVKESELDRERLAEYAAEFMNVSA